MRVCRLMMAIDWGDYSLGVAVPAHKYKCFLLWHLEPMDQSAVHDISEEALKILEALSQGYDKTAIRAASRILETCEEFERRSKKRKIELDPVKAPEPTKGDPEQALAEKNAQDLLEKPVLQAESRSAGEFVIPFGKHKGVAIRALPCAYVCWLMGMRREGKTFQQVSTTSLDWIRGNQFETLSMAKKYLTWRCWACGSADVRFRHAKLCTSCWHDG